MTNAAWDVRTLTDGDWQLLRDTRLWALNDSPDAFMSHSRREAAWGEREWRRMFQAASWLVACAGEAIGLIRSASDPVLPQSRQVESIWVAPTYRKRGVCRALLHTLIDLERRAGVRDVLLWVLEDNHDALRVYERLGFESTGKRQPLGDATERFECQLRLAIG